jgi:hypothetical protein
MVSATCRKIKGRLAEGKDRVSLAPEEKNREELQLRQNEPS